MAFGFVTRLRPDRLRLASWPGIVVLGGLIALGAVAPSGYGWLASGTEIQRSTNLSPENAERIARRYGEQQLQFVEATSTMDERRHGAGAMRASELANTGRDWSALTLVDSRFLSGTSAGPADSKRPNGGAWLFVFRVEGIRVAEWRTQEAVLEVQVVLSDATGRVFQAGVTLLPREPESAPGNR